MKEKSKSFLLILALFAVSLGTFVSCNDYDSDVTADIKGQVGDLNSIVSGQITNLDDLHKHLDRVCDSLYNYADRFTSDSANVQQQIGILKNVSNRADSVAKAATDSLGVLKQQVNELMLNAGTPTGEVNDSLVSYNTRILELSSKLNNKILEYDGNIQGVQNSLSGIRDSIGTALGQIVTVGARLDSCVQLWTPMITQLVADANYALALARQDSLNIVNLNTSVNNSLDSARYAIQLANTNLELAKKFAEKADSMVLKQAKDYADGILDDAKGYTDIEIDKVIAAYKAADQNLRDSIIEIQDSLGAHRADLNSLRADLNSMITKYEYLSNKVASLITSILIQGTENPIFGSMSLPTNFNTNFLAAYYGEVAGSNDVNFPTDSPENYANAEQADGFVPQIAPELVAYAGDKLVSNAGKLYLTINPTNVVFNNLRVSLVNSRDEKAAGYNDLVITPSDKLLSFGMGRAASANGFYEAVAQVNDPDAAKPNVNVTTLKNVVKDALNKITNRSNPFSLTDAVAKVYNELNGVLPAYGVKATWDETDSEGNPTTNSVYSEYKIAATAIPALSYSFLIDGTSYTLPRIPSLESKGFIFDHFTWEGADTITMDPISVTLTIPDANNIVVKGDGVTPPITLDKVWNDILGDTIIENVTVGDIDFSQVKVEIGEKDTTIKVDVPYSQFNDVIRSMNDQVGGMLGSVNDLVDRFNSTVQQLDSRFITRVNGVISRLETLVQNPNKLLQICLLYEDLNGNFAQANTVSRAPSILKLNGQSTGAIHLYPTSYTAEIFAPAFKKYIAVTNVTGAPDNAAARDYANQGINMNKVIPGDTRDVLLQVNAPGVYEIAYSAVDFCGKIATRKFYVEVVQ